MSSSTAGLKRLIVAIDGPAGAGKSTVAAFLARHFGLLNLETGAMYRAFALKALQQGVAASDEAALLQLAAHTRIALQPIFEGNRVLLDGAEVTGQLREPRVTAAASEVSVHPGVRRWLVDLQREMGRDGGVVMEGRDIGTVVFPQAQVKLFLDADPEVRGDRRFRQTGTLSAAPHQAQAAVQREMRERDARDRNRADSPLRPAPDATVIDTTHMTLEDVLQRAEKAVARAIGQA